tara:strand:- start:962 stop:1066 length:105 start_codon:yes stop_codon:yes gene_type:complete
VDIFVSQKSELVIIQEVTKQRPEVRLIAMTAFEA